MSSGGDVTQALKLVKIPIRAYASREDLVTPFSETEQMVNAIKNEGGRNISFIINENGAHDTWSTTFAQKELYDWLFSQK
jgi:predicted peptidase